MNIIILLLAVIFMVFGLFFHNHKDEVRRLDAIFSKYPDLMMDDLLLVLNAADRNLMNKYFSNKRKFRWIIKEYIFTLVASFVCDKDIAMRVFRVVLVLLTPIMVLSFSSDGLILVLLCIAGYVEMRSMLPTLIKLEEMVEMEGRFRLGMEVSVSD